jgi:glutathione S-transferase
MRRLYHFSLCPSCRVIRILLKEKELPFELIEERPWERSDRLMRLNPATNVPVLVDDEYSVISGFYPIIEWLEETATERSFLGKEPQERAENRRLIDWFSYKMHQEVTHYILNERVLRFHQHQEQPDASAIRAAKHNLYTHMDYIDFLLKKRSWLGPNQLSLADITAAAFLSILDYFGDVPWDYSHSVKEWYALMKSRPSMRPLLADRLSGFPPSRHYTDPDF